MGATEAIVLLALATYATRVAGFVAGGQALPAALDRFLANVPVAVFAALVVVGLGVGTAEAPVRLVAVAVAAVVAARGGPLWATLAVGLAAFWVIRVV